MVTETLRGNGAQRIFYTQIEAITKEQFTVIVHGKTLDSRDYVTDNTTGSWRFTLNKAPAMMAPVIITRSTPLRRSLLLSDQTYFELSQLNAELDLYLHMIQELRAKILSNG